jgi:transmembrane 9 superfamily member 2/4
MSSRGWLVRAGWLAVSLVSYANAFYLPGAAPHDYARGEQVDVFVNALTPMLSGKDDAKLVRQAVSVLTFA